MGAIKEATILNDIPLSIVKAGQIIQLANNQTYLVIFNGQDRFLVPVLLENWIKYNIHDVKQPDIIRVFGNKAKGKCLYVKKSILEDQENEEDV